MTYSFKANIAHVAETFAMGLDMEEFDKGTVVHNTANNTIVDCIYLEL